LKAFNHHFESLNFYMINKIRELADPKGLLGSVDRAVLLLREDKQALFSQA